MKRRGRPPHPDILTPREWEVLELLRDGLSNPEIAERLGVTRDAVKYHVSEILSKLGVTSREDAAVWRPYERPWWAAAFAALSGAAVRLSPLARIAAIGASVFVLGGLGLLAWGVLATRENGEGKDQRTLAQASPSGVPVPTSGGATMPGLLAGLDIQPLTIGPSVEFPRDVALIVETGKWNCGCPMTGLVRLYRDSSGVFRRDELLTVEKLGLGPRRAANVNDPAEGAPYIRSSMIRAEGAEMFAAVCVAAECDGIGGPDPDERLALFHSIDGGVAWKDLGELGPGRRLLGITAPGQILLGVYDFEASSWSYQTFPDGGVVHPPHTSFPYPAVLSTGDIIWQSDESKFVHSDGTLFIDPGTVRQDEQFLVESELDQSGQSALVRAIHYQTPQPTNYYASVDASGRPIKAWSSSDISLYLGPWFQAGNFFANAERYIFPERRVSGQAGTVPLLFDVEDGTVHLIESPFLEPDFPQGRNLISAVQRGPFARVVNTEGGCLNIRADPGTGAVLDCAAEAVLLRDLGQTAEAEGAAWLQVATPTGIEGWASTEYLER